MTEFAMRPWQKQDCVSRFLKFGLSVMAILLLAACSESSSDVVHSVKIDQRDLRLLEAAEAQLTVSVRPDPEVDAELVWSSSDPSIANITGDSGYVTAVSPGTVEITVQSIRFPELSDAVSVRVSAPTDYSDLVLTSFSVQAELNEELSSTVNGLVGDDSVLLLFSEGLDPTGLIPTFTTQEGDLFIGDTVQNSGVTITDFRSQFEYSLRSWDGLERNYAVDAIVLDELKNVVPHIYITTESREPVESKVDRVPAVLAVDGLGEYDDVLMDIEIRGRGNTSWTWPKKPYQLKLDSKLDLLGLPAGKKWILLSNWGEKSLMGNAIAMKLGRLLDLPFTHDILPVDVTVNGEFMGSYMLTQHKEVEENRIDLPSLGADPVYLEFSPHHKEKHYQFTSSEYGLLVTIRHPRLKHVAEDEIGAVYDPIVEDFTRWEELLVAPDFPENGYRDHFDIHSLAQFLLVNLFAGNYEISRPNSVYMYRVDGVYHMGPLWDFDAGWGMKDGETFADPEVNPLSRYPLGQAFFSRLMEDPVFLRVFRQEWERFKTELYPKLVIYMEGYSALIRESYLRDYEVWKFGLSDFDLVVSQMFDWFDLRMAHLDATYFQ